MNHLGLDGCPVEHCGGLCEHKSQLFSKQLQSTQNTITENIEYSTCKEMISEGREISKELIESALKPSTKVFDRYI